MTRRSFFFFFFLSVAIYDQLKMIHICCHESEISGFTSW
jgi:hypothetical protein